MALNKTQNLSIALLFTALAAGCSNGVSQSHSYNNGPGLPPSASRPLPADIPASQMQPREGAAYLGAQRHNIEGLEDMSWKERVKCLGKRIDTDHTLTYHHDRRRSTHLDIDNLDDDPRITLSYEIILGPNPEKARENHICRFDSRWQGVLGSLGNELFVRKEDRIGQDFQRILGGKPKNPSP